MKFEQKKSLEEKFEFRKLNSGDWDKYKKVRLQALETDPEAFGGALEAESKIKDQEWKERLNDNDWSFYGAQQKDDLVSIANLSMIDSNNWRIQGVYTMPEFRGKHLSESLLNQIIIDAKQKKAKKVSLFVNTTQEGAISLYKKLGFETAKIYKNEILGNGIICDLNYMEKDLTQ